jgi:anti-anti-sigma regulatory factor
VRAHARREPRENPGIAQLSVTFSGAYGFDRLERMIETVEPLLRLDEPAVITVDLRRLVFFGPTALALLLAALRRVRELGLNESGSAIVPPATRSVRQYVERMDLLRGVVEERRETFKRRKRRASDRAMASCSVQRLGGRRARVAGGIVAPARSPTARGRDRPR